MARRDDFVSPPCERPQAQASTGSTERRDRPRPSPQDHVPVHPPELRAPEPSRAITDAAQAAAWMARALEALGPRATAADVPQATAWLRDWAAAKLEPHELPELGPALACTFLAQCAWERGGPSGVEPGLITLHREALRAARGDVAKASAAATDTWIDVRERLQLAVERRRAGRSLPNFGAEAELSLAQQAHRYHRLQLHLRLTGRWRRAPDTAPFDDVTAADEALLGGPSAVEQEAEARTSALALHFAAFWYRLDAEAARGRRGKGAAWWWAMLQHGLGIASADGPLGGDRNDPAEATGRVQLRLSTSLGLLRWLRAWASARPYWMQVSFSLPDPQHPAGAEVEGALQQLRPALSALLTDRGPERRALHRLLLEGGGIRSALPHFEGDGPAARRQRMLDLAEQSGGEAADALLSDGRGPGPRRGPDRCAAAGRQALRHLRDGRLVEAGPLQRAQAHLNGCADCQAWWAATVEAQPVIAALVAATPAPPRSRAPRGWLAGIIAAAVILTFVLPSPPPPIGLRGPAPAAPGLRLELTVERAGGPPERVALGQRYAVGDRLRFRVGADQADVPAYLWVEGPAGRTPLGALDLQPTPAWVGGGGTFVALDAPGAYEIVLSTDPTACPPDRCARLRVEVEATVRPPVDPPNDSTSD